MLPYLFLVTVQAHHTSGNRHCVAITLTMVEIASTWCGKNTRTRSRNDRRLMMLLP
jgi:hypothetical protein